jgi:ABC-type protease/lipase transport system fused ATPase/permease subunit
MGIRMRLSLGFLSSFLAFVFISIPYEGLYHQVHFKLFFWLGFCFSIFGMLIFFSGMKLFERYKHAAETILQENKKLKEKTA